MSRSSGRLLSFGLFHSEGFSEMPTPTTPYPTAQDALNAAITFANDGGSPLGMAGNILNPSRNPQVLPTLQECWIYLQQRLISNGVDTFTKTAPIFGLPAAATSSRRAVMLLTYNGFFDGLTWSGPNITAPLWSHAVTYTQGQTVTYNNVYYVALPNSATNLNQEPDTATTFWVIFTNIGPCLPPDLVKPLEISECNTGGPAWVPMAQCPDVLANNLITARFRKWAFSNNTLKLPPASQMNDILLTYLAMAPPIATLQSPLMVPGVARALGLQVLYVLSGGRGGPMADTYKVWAEEAINQILNQTVRKQAYSNFERPPYRGGRRGRRG